MLICSFSIQSIDNWNESRRVAECCICRSEIWTEEKFVFCPFCESVFHPKHIQQWLKIKNNCPICNTDLKGLNLRPIVEVKGCSKSLRVKTFTPDVPSYRKAQKTRSKKSVKIKHLYTIRCPRCGTLRDIQLHKN